MEPSIEWIILLFAVGAVAGCVDAIGGGGGLLTLPALLLAGLPPDRALGTNKGQGVFGTAVSLWRFARSPLLDRKRVAESFIAALVGAAAGALLVSHLAQAILTPLIMALLMVASAVMILRPPQPRARRPRRPLLLAVGIAFVLAFYDGFFGPGTGTLLIMANVWLFGDALERASANAKIVNFASNLASVAAFASRGLILWPFVVPMALGQALGAFIGAHLTIHIGPQLVRYVVLVVSVALIIRLIWGLT